MGCEAFRIRGRHEQGTGNPVGTIYGRSNSGEATKAVRNQPDLTDRVVDGISDTGRPLINCCNAPAVLHNTLRAGYA